MVALLSRVFTNLKNKPCCSYCLIYERREQINKNK